MPKKTLPVIYFTVTSDLTYDQRMIRICASLTKAGYRVILVGRQMKTSVPLTKYGFGQKRLHCFSEKGKLFYAEYNFRLFFYLLFKKMDGICAIDLDSIMPCYFISNLKKVPRIYDAHEYFSQQKEIVSRPIIYKIWHSIEKTMLPKFKYGYTVGEKIAESFQKLYGLKYKVMRNIPLLQKDFFLRKTDQSKAIILYQGAINEARGIEFLIPAMCKINAELHFYGDGNFMEQAKQLISTNNLDNKVFIKKKLLPRELNVITKEATIGVNLVEDIGLNQYYSLANKFFDLIHNGIPQVTMNYPEYRKINDQYEVAVLIDDLKIDTIASAINNLLENKELYNRLQQNCLKARLELNWQEEEKKLLDFYKNIFG